MFDPFDEEDEPGALYENGHWEWSDVGKELVFLRDLVEPEEEFASNTPAVFGNIEFKDDLDLMEQQRFRKRFQRKPEGEEDVIFLQDIKDVVLYTAPSSLMTPSVINILHQPSTERFIRALICYCQFYLQTADEMSRRILELETKIRTKTSIQMELELRDNVEDLRLLVGKEYVAMILGAGDYRKYHHMGPQKKSRSLSKKDVTVFESILRISIQIVWLALGRKSFNQIEIEINRIFKSQIFNMVEHKLKTNYLAKMAPIERAVLLGHCLRQGQKLTTRSPLVNELVCERRVDFRLFGLATTRFPVMTPRLRYLEQMLSISERLFQQQGIVLGILGLQRSRFDTLLREITMTTSTSTSTASMRGRSVSKASRSSVRKSTMTSQRLYHEIELPSKEYDKEWLPTEYPTKSIAGRYCNPLQRLKWLARAARRVGLQISVARRLHDLRPLHSMHTTKLNRQ